MAKTREDPCITYVYILYREDGVTPFYVGKGRNSRWLIHERDAWKGNSRKDRIIQSMTARGFTDIPKLKVASDLSDPQAKALERFLIAAIGRAPHGPLVNHTDGGDGVENLSDEAKAKKAAANVLSWARADVRQKRLDGIKAHWTAEKRAIESAKRRQKITPESRLAMGAQARANWDDPGTAARMRAAMSSPEVQAAKSKGLKEAWSQPGVKEKRAAAMTGKKRREETKQKIGRATKRSWQNPEYRKRLIDNINHIATDAEIVAKRKATLSRPEIRAKFVNKANTPEANEKRSATLRAYLSTPEAKAKRSATSIAMWARKKAAQKVLPSGNPTAVQAPHKIPGPPQPDQFPQ